MADLNQRFLTYVKGLRDTQFAAHATQALDNDTLVKNDLATVRNTTPTKSDVNSIYYVNLP